jgi:hypothetical protein
MMVKCASGEELEDSLIFVCHHCGAPVCEQHGWVVSADDAFKDTSTPVSRAAMHCRDCVEAHPRNANRHHYWADPKAQPNPGAWPGPQPGPAPEGQARAAGRT